jgi:hypothetical protein
MLCLYPLAWRERYEQEMIALLEQHQITLWTVLVFCFSLLFWSGMGWGADFPCNGDAASCAVAHAMGVYNASLAATIEGIALLLMSLSLFPFLLVLLGWIGLQARRTQDLLRVLPVALLVLLCLLVLYVSLGPWAYYAGPPGHAVRHHPALCVMESFPKQRR